MVLVSTVVAVGRREVQVDRDGVRIGDRGADLGGGRASASSRRSVERPGRRRRAPCARRGRTRPGRSPPCRRARSARTGDRGSCSSGGSSTASSAPGDSVSAKRCSSASTGRSGSGQATSCSTRSGCSSVDPTSPRGELPSSWPRPRPGLDRCAGGRSGCTEPPRARLAIDGYRRRVDSITRSSVSRSPSDGSGPSSRATTMASCSLRRCWAMKMRRSASVSVDARRQVGHAVVGQRPQQPVAEPGGQALALGVERPQVDVQVLAGRRGCRRQRPCRGAPGRARTGRRRRRGPPARRGPMRSSASRRRASGGRCRRRSRARTRGRARCRRRPRGHRRARAARSMRSVTSLVGSAVAEAVRSGTTGCRRRPARCVVTKTSRTRPLTG